MVKMLEGDKLAVKSSKCWFVGYPKETIRYYFVQPDEQKLFISGHAYFLEEAFIQDQGKIQGIEIDEVSLESQTKETLYVPINTILEKGTPRRSERVSRPLKRYLELIDK